MDFGCWGETITDWLLGEKCATDDHKLSLKQTLNVTIWHARINKNEAFILLTHDPFETVTEGPYRHVLLFLPYGDTRGHCGLPIPGAVLVCSVQRVESVP